MKKYIMTEKIKLFGSTTLHQIQAVRSFGNARTRGFGKRVEEGDLGGWIEKEENLSHEGDAWIYGNAVVLQNARVFQNAKVGHDTYICHDAKVFGNARVHGSAGIVGHAQVFDRACIFGNAEVHGNARVYGDAYVYNYGEVCDDGRAYGNAKVYGNAVVSCKAEIFDKAILSGNTRITDYAKIGGAVCIDSGVIVGNNGLVKSLKDIMWLGPIDRCTTELVAYRTASGEIEVRCGGWFGKLSEFRRYSGVLGGMRYSDVLRLIESKFTVAKEPDPHPQPLYERDTSGTELKIAVKLLENNIGCADLKAGEYVEKWSDLLRSRPNYYIRDGKVKVTERVLQNTGSELIAVKESAEQPQSSHECDNSCSAPCSNSKCGKSDKTEDQCAVKYVTESGITIYTNDKLIEGV